MINKLIYNADEIFEDDPDNPENTLMKIPEEIAEKMGWQPGDVLKITMEDGAISITKVNNDKK
jgi:AbrB family looped-hinge helix DNA binding protein